MGRWMVSEGLGRRGCGSTVLISWWWYATVGWVAGIVSSVKSWSYWGRRRGRRYILGLMLVLSGVEEGRWHVVWVGVWYRLARAFRPFCCSSQKA